MADQVEQHGCIVCGRLHTVKVSYGAGGQVQNCFVTSLEGHCVEGLDRVIVACNSHSQAEIEAAYAKHAPGKKDEEEEEEDK